MYHILLQLVRFCRLYIKNILVCFSVHSVDVLCVLIRSCTALMVSLELPGESVVVLQTLAFDLRWSSLTTLLKQAIQGFLCSKLLSIVSNCVVLL